MAKRKRKLLKKLIAKKKPKKQIKKKKSVKKRRITADQKMPKEKVYKKEKLRIIPLVDEHMVGLAFPDSIKKESTAFVAKPGEDPAAFAIRTKVLIDKYVEKGVDPKDTKLVKRLLEISMNPKHITPKWLETFKKDFGKRDKIFENNYNMGNVSTEHLPTIKVDSEYAVEGLDERERKKLMQLAYTIFKASQWGSLPLNKKFSKEIMPYIFNDLFKGMDNGSAVIDIFICIAEFMDISYERVYDIANLRARERVVKELEDKYRVLSKRHINRLF